MYQTLNVKGRLLQKYSEKTAIEPDKPLLSSSLTYALTNIAKYLFLASVVCKPDNKSSLKKIDSMYRFNSSTFFFYIHRSQQNL